MNVQSNEAAQKTINEDFPLALPKGTILAGQYTIDDVLGQGGFGITYVATDYKTGQKVAVKEFFPDSLAYREMTTVISYPGERAENYEYGKENFLGEAKTLAEFIGCENIVRIYSYFEENGTAYFVMEYIEGVSFDHYLREKGGKISCDEAKSILVPVMEALAIVHSKGIVHRDVTPDNIYITSDGTVKLLDFGAARYSLGDKSKSLDVILKHGFAPKEQYTRRGKQGPFTDIYSLGATFYFSVTGRRPPDSIDRIEEDELIPPSSLGVKITSYQEEAILHALEVSPQSRYQSMLDFRNVLLNETSPAPASKAVNQQFFNAPPTPAAMPAQQIPYTAQQIPYTAQQVPYTAQQAPYTAQQQPYAMPQQQPYAMPPQQPYAMPPQQQYPAPAQQPQTDNVSKQLGDAAKQFGSAAVQLGGGMAKQLGNTAKQLGGSAAKHLGNAAKQLSETAAKANDKVKSAAAHKESKAASQDAQYDEALQSNTAQNADAPIFRASVDEVKEEMENTPPVRRVSKKDLTKIMIIAVCCLLIISSIMLFRTKEVIDKEYSADMFTVDNVYTDLDGTYSGEWKLGKPTGYGTITFSNGSSYSGAWKNGKANGTGTLVYKDGRIYEGEWKNNRKDGKGKLTYTSTDSSNRVYYDGEWKNGEKNGQGVMKWTDGEIYDGEWKNDKRDGKGKVTFASNDGNNRAYYDGEWKNDEKNGQGVMEWTNGNIYDGEWKDDGREGHGVFKWKSGSVYDGEWKDDSRNGQGKMTYPENDENNRLSYEGEWQDGEKSGKGVFKWTDGKVYEGEFKDDVRNGEGKMTYADGSVTTGIWKDDKLIEEKAITASEPSAPSTPTVSITDANANAKTCHTATTACLVQMYVNGESEPIGVLEGSDTNVTVGGVKLDKISDSLGGNFTGYTYGYVKGIASVEYALWSDKPIPNEYKHQLTAEEQEELNKSGTVIGCFPLKEEGGEFKVDEDVYWTDVLGKSPDQAAKILEKTCGVSLPYYNKEASSIYNGASYNLYYTSKTNSAIPFPDTDVYFNSIEIDYTNDNVVYSVSFHYAGSKFLDESTYRTGSECITLRDALYEGYNGVFGEPYEIEEGYDGYSWYTWDIDGAYDLFLCGGENLWGIDGYNDVVFTLTDKNLKPKE